MDPLSAAPAIACIALAVGTGWILMLRVGAPAAKGRAIAIDGLRGYLALFVFIHHASVWYFFARSGKFIAPLTKLYAHFGQSSVTLFFMITGFLFFTRLLNHRTRPIDWLQFFVSRLTRLFPLYLFTMSLLFIIVFCLTNGTLVQSPWAIAKSALKWIGFTILGSPDLNGVTATNLILSGVIWSLPYEWFFYAILPLMALCIGIVPPRLYLAIGVTGLIGLTVWEPYAKYLWPFAGGIAAALLSQMQSLKNFAATTAASALALSCIVATVGVFEGAYASGHVVLLSIAFTMIASGTDLFGALSAPISRFLGELAYSVYLLHGIVLYVAFKFAIGLQAASAITPIQHWMIIFCLTPLLIVCCFLTFYLIERPGVRATVALTFRLRNLARVNRPSL